jgi:hypothetical protein
MRPAIKVAALAFIVCVVGTSRAKADLTFNLFDNSGESSSIAGYVSLYSRADYSGYVAQPFNTGSGGTLTKVFLSLMRSPDVNNDATFDLYVAPDNSGQPTEPLTSWSTLATGINIVGNLAQTNTFDTPTIISELQNTGDWYLNQSLSEVSLPADSTYWLVVGAVNDSRMTSGLLYFGYGTFTGGQNAGSSGPNPQLTGRAAYSNDELQWFTYTPSSQGMGLEIVAPVPEPSTSCMALAGLACGGYTMFRRRKRGPRGGLCTSAAACLGLVVACLVSNPVHAASVIAWGSAQNVSGASDVDTTGTLLYAYQFSTSLTGTTTVNGVQFQPFNVPLESTGGTVGDVTLTAVSQSPYDAVFYSTNSDTSPSNPFAALSAEYQSLLSSSVTSSAFDIGFGQPMSIQLGSLTPGTDYLVQLWSSSTVWWNLTQTLALGSPNVTLSSNTSGTAGGVGQYAIGTFTAVGSSQTFTLEGADMYSPGFQFPLINAFQIRAVPEPSTFCVALAGLACGGYTMFRRRKRA